MINREELLKIGQFNKPHGIHGEISFTFSNDIFDRVDCPFFICEIEGIFVPFSVEEYRFRGDNSALIKLEDIDTEEEARAFILKEVYVLKSYLQEGEDECETAPCDFFIGFEVYDESLGLLGKIIEVDDSTMNVLFVVENNEGKEILVPANDDFVVEIDENKRTLVLNIPLGLIEIND